MGNPTVKRKLSAILSADVKNYSRLMADDEVATVAAIKACRQILFNAIARHRGRVVDSPGDNVLSEFSSVVDAVACAVESQNGLAVYNKDLPEERRMEFRMGVNLGDVIQDSDQIYGDGVNIASRLEGMARGGGICISGSAYEQVKNRLNLGFEFLGPRALKNIADKVPVYAVLTDPDAAGRLYFRDIHDDPGFRKKKRWFAGLMVCLLVLGAGFIFRPHPPDLSPRTAGLPSPSVPRPMGPKVPEKPSIAVLPFLNMSGDKSQEYFSDGLTEDLIMDLSRVSGLFVIARNSMFFYKEKSVKVSEIGRDLGVKYVLEGSVRKVGKRVRITAQLIDARTEGHIWAERYDRDMADIFALQDEVRAKIVSALAVRMTVDDQKRMQSHGTVNPDAYDLYLKANNLCNSSDYGKLAGGRDMLSKAIQLDPGFAKAHAAMAKTYFTQWVFGPDKDPAILEKVHEWAQKAKSLDPAEASGYSLAALYYLWTKQHGMAVTEIRNAIALDPGNAEYLASLGDFLTYAGKPGEGIPYFMKAMRLDPKYPVWTVYGLGHAYFLLDDYDTAIATFEKAVIRDPLFWPSYLLMAAAYDAKGMQPQALETAQKALELNPNIPHEKWEERVPYKDPASVDEIMASFRKIGIYQ